MTRISDAHEAELLTPVREKKVRTRARSKKSKISQEDIDIIDVPSTPAPAKDAAEDASLRDAPDESEKKVRKRPSRTSAADDAAAKDNDESPSSEQTQDEPSADEDTPEVMEAELEQAQEGELLPDDDALDDDFSDFDDKHRVIDLDSNLPALAEDRLPSVPVRDNLQSYLREVSKFPLLEPEEETELARRVRDHGDSEAAFRIISSHLRLVVRIAMDFQRRWMQNVLDLIQEGNVGLMRAVNKFDPDKGIKFSYYASFWIKAYILKFIMDNWRMVKIGTTQAQRKLFYNLNRERQKLILQGFDPDAAMLSEKLGVTQDQVVEMQQRLDAGDVSLDLPVSDENGSASRMDFLPALGPGVEEGIADSEVSRLVRESIHELIPSLSEKEVYILEHRLLTDEPATLREIGERYHVTRERIRQLEARLLEKLKEHLGREIKDFSEDWIQP